MGSKSPVAHQLQRLVNGPRSVFFFRNFGAVAISLVVCSMPSLGPNRFWVAGILTFFCIPTAIALERKLPISENGWVQPLFDLSAVVVLVHFLPTAWVPALVIGLMVVQAPSVTESHASHRLYAVFASILTVGMAFAAVVHDVPNWGLPILAMVVLYPSIIYYSYLQAAKAQEIREQAAALSGLTLVAGGVAHDFNNILTGVMGYAEVALADLPEDHEARASIDEVIGGTARASLLAARLLAFAGREAAVEERVNVEQDVEGLLGLLRPVVPKGTTIELVSDLDGVWLMTRRSQLQQIVMNLVLNASEASPAQANRVRVELSLEEVPRPFLRLVVSDDGPGIPADLRTRVFEPLFTLKEHGHGLGLSIVRSIVSGLGGRIEVESDAASGTRMRVWLPATRAAAPDGEKQAPQRRAIGGTALVVDDELSVRATLSRMLDDLGYRVSEAASASEALAQFTEHEGSFDVVLLDLRMPGTDGWQALGELREIRADVPVLICSGADSRGDERTRAEGVGYLPKPFRFAELRRALEELPAAVPATGPRAPA